MFSVLIWLKFCVMIVTNVMSNHVVFNWDSVYMSTIGLDSVILSPSSRITENPMGRTCGLAVSPISKGAGHMYSYRSRTRSTKVGLCKPLVIYLKAKRPKYWNCQEEW
jgi:hypothetical protein